MDPDSTNDTATFSSKAQSELQKFISEAALRCLFVPALMVGLALSALAQTAARPDRGVRAAGSYSVSEIENISLTNGNVNISIPLAALPSIAGGKLAWIVRAEYSSKQFDRIGAEKAFNWPLTGGYTENTLQVSGAGGWRVGGIYEISVHSVNEDYAAILPTDLNDPETHLIGYHLKMILTTPDGAKHELRPLDYPSYPGNLDYRRGYYKDTPSSVNAPMRYYSFDGSYIWARIDPYPAGGPTSWTVVMPDGLTIEHSNGIQRIRDSNGNKIKIFTTVDGSGRYTTHYQDEQTGREILTGYNAATNSYGVHYQAVGGAWQTIEINSGTTMVQGLTYSASTPAFCGQTPFFTGLSVVRSIVFPQTEPGVPRRQFTFSYNSDQVDSVNAQWSNSCTGGSGTITQASHGWGSLSQMVMPSGATVNYEYKLDGAQRYLPNSDADHVPREAITRKTIIHDGTSDVWTYDIGGAGGSVTGPDGSVTTETFYPHDPGYNSYRGGEKAGLVYRSNRSGKELVERQWALKEFSGGNNTTPGGLLGFNQVVQAEYMSLLDSGGNAVKMSAKTFQYDFNGNLTQETDYDWFDPALVSRDGNGVPTSVPGSATVLRVINNSHYNQAGSAASANVYAKRAVATGAPLILNAPQQTIVGPSTVQFSYDGQAYGVAPTMGNLTGKKVWDDLDAKWLTTSSTYGLYGNVATATDARGKVTQFYFDDATHALPTRVMVDPQNGTDPQTTSTAYDYATGLVVSQTDVNGQVTTIDYTNQLLSAVDPFGRPGITKSPIINIDGTNQQRRVTTTYLDAARRMIVATDLDAENDQLLKTRTTVDQLGRPVLTETTEDGTNYTISVKSAYLEMGRVTLTSSAMRSTASSTDSWTRVTKDNAGRAIEVATFGGAAQPAWSGTAGVYTGKVTTAYDANFTTITDQAGKVRRSMVDALGQLRRIDEPDAANDLGSTASPVQPTGYTYDALGNLTTVTQGSQSRAFSYDSLSRLRTALNPESGTVSYQYDDNGNLLVKTDARGVSAHYEYDALNRATRRWYNGSNAMSATTHNSPVLPGGVGATDEVRFYYDSQALPAGAPSYARGAAVGRLVAQTYGPGSNGDYYAFDVLGRPTLKVQQTGTSNYQLSAVYALSGAVNSLTYPSGRMVTNSFDQAGRLIGFSGNLGDGTARTYANGILYSPIGGLVKEQFGTTTPIYNKLFYNSRGQLAEIRASTSYTGPTDTSWDRGAIINSYSEQCSGVCSGSNMSDNNGNLQQQEIYIPNELTRSQYFAYDSLNRLQYAREVLNGTEQWKQQFTYDRWGNRTINTGVTYGAGINNKAFTVDSANNRLGVPSGQPGMMSYDAAGNLSNDTYTGAGNRAYDAENRITSAWGGNNQAQLYGYDAKGQRIKRTVDGVETWQVYGFGGELVAEYAANGAVTSPQKEYGYRNGQMLVTASGTPRVNVAAAANGGTATASETNSAPYAASGAINGDRKYYLNNAWANSTATLPQWLQVDFNGSKVIDEIDVFSVQDVYNAPSEPTATMTFNAYGLREFEVQYWNGTGWVTVSGGSVSGNNKVWRQLTFAALTTSKIRIWITGSADGYSRITEVEAWGTSVPVSRQNVAAAANGGTATASETNSAPYAASGALNGDRKYYLNNAWANSSATLPQWLQVDFNGSKDIDEVDVFSVQDLYNSPSEPTPAMTFSAYGLTTFQVQYWNGSTWLPVANGSVSGNSYVWKQLTFASVTTTKIRVWITGTADGYSRITEVEAWGTPSGSGGSAPSAINWLVSDQLGTPRMIIDQTGNLANLKRHDYLPFGEELFAPAGGRKPEWGYSIGDGIRQQFTQKERDVETGLDYFLARYYSSTQGRFTSPDDFLNDTHVDDPASWNLYAYVRNNPLRYVDPAGEEVYSTNLSDEQKKRLIEDWQNKTGYKSISFDKNNKLVIDTKAGFQGGSAKARDQLSAAVNSTDIRFNLKAVDTTKVAFAEVDGGTTVQDYQTKATRTDYTVSIDFGDFTRAGGDDAAKEAFSVGLVAIHEFDHRIYSASDSPNSATDPGPLERTYINPIRQELGLAQRVHYTSRPVDAAFKNFYPGGGQQINFRLNGKDKVIRWRNDLVGGKIKD